jgi:hypothetical protein
MGIASNWAKGEIMSQDAEKNTAEMIAKLRKLKGIAPMTPEEADTAYDDAPAEPLSQDRIRSIVESVASGELASWEPLPDLGWTSELNLEEVEEDAMQLYRNKGEGDEASDVEDELRRELLDDGDESEESHGMDEGAAPSGDGQ